MTTTVLVLDDTGTQYDLTTSASGSYVSYIPPGATGTWSWISELYGFQRQTGTFTPATGGSININPSWSRDLSVTVSTESIVSLYTSIDNLDELYDYSCLVRRTDPVYVVLTAAAGKIFTEADIVLDGTATVLWDYDDVTETLTIGTALLASGVTLTGIETTGTISLTNGAVITSLFTDSSGNSSKLNYTGLVNSTVYLTNNLGVQQDLQFNKTGTYTQFIPTSATGTWNWVVEGYGYTRQTASVNFVGGNYSAIIAYSPDSNITELSVSVVAAYTEITTLNQLYDYAAYMRTQQPQYVLASKNGISIDFGSVNIVIDSTATTIWNYDQPTHTLTIKSSNLASFTKFTTLLTTGTISRLNGAVITSLYTSSTGPSARLTYSNLTNATIFTTTGASVQYDLQTGITGSLVNYFVPGLTGTYRWYTEQYGFQRQTGFFTPGTGGDFFAAPNWIPDSNITQPSSLLVAAYTTISTVDQLYDYAAYMRTQQPQYVIASKNGNVLEFGATNIIFDSAAATLWAYNLATDTVTIKTTTLNSGTKMNKVSTTGTITIQSGTTVHALHSSVAGNSARLNFTNLTNSTLFIIDELAAEYQTEFDKTGTFTSFLSIGETGTWTWFAERYGYLRQTGIFAPAPGGDIAALPLWIADLSINALLSAVTAYTKFDNLDQIYDYAAYMRTVDPEFVIVTKNGTSIDFGNTNIIVDSAASQIWSYNSTTNTLTLKTELLLSGSEFIKLTTTGLLTIATSTYVAALYSHSGGNSSRVFYNDLIDSTVLTLDNLGVAYDTGTDFSGLVANIIDSGKTGTWTWNIERYGYRRQTGSFLPAVGGDTNINPIWTSDSYITVTDQTLVAAYSSVSTLDQLYDLAAYMRTREPLYQIISTSGTTMNLGSTNLVLDATALVPWSYNNATNTLTVKTVTLTPGIKSTQLLTTGSVTFANGAITTAVYTNSVGTSTNFTITNIPTGSSLYIGDNLGNQVRYMSGVSSSTIVTYIAPGQTGNWVWTVEKYGNVRQSYIFTPSGGIQSSSVIAAPDVSITELTQATVAAYTSLETADKLYDYVAYYRLSNTGIKIGSIATRSSFSVDFGIRSLTIDNTAANMILVTTSTVTIKAPSMSAGTTFTRLSTSAPGLITSANSEPINLKISDALGARATITGLDPEGFGITWFMRYKLATASTYTYLSGTGNGVNLLVANGSYTFEIRASAYEWTTMTLDTTNSLDLNVNLQYHKASDDSPQWLKGFDSTVSAIFDYDPAATKVAANNVSGTLIQANFAEMYQALQRITHLPTLVWVWTNPVRAVAATQTIIIPTGNPIAMFLTTASTSSVRITCQIVHAIDGTVAFDRVQGNSSGFAIFLGTSQASEIASLRTDIVADIVAKIGGTGFTTLSNSLVVLTAELDNKPTLTEIEDSTVLATEETVNETLKAAKLAAALSA